MTQIITKELTELAAKINRCQDLLETHAANMVTKAREMGEHLISAKAQVEHGEWEEWCLQNIDRVSDRQVRKYMRLAKHWDEIEQKRAGSSALSIEESLGLISAKRYSNTVLDQETSGKTDEADNKSRQSGGEPEPGAASDGEEPPPAGNSRETSIPEGVTDAVDVKDVTEPAEGTGGIDVTEGDDTDGTEADTDLCAVDLAEAVLSGWGLLRDNWDHVEDIDKPAILDWCQQTLEREGYVVRKRAAKKKTSSKYSEDFEEFWSVYPSVRKRSKGKAWEAWRRAIRDTDPEEITSAAQEYAESEIGQGEFCQMPTTWLNGRCWEDDRSSWREPSSNGRSRLSDTERAANEFMESFS